MTDVLLLETGDRLLTEDEFLILLEQSSVTTPPVTDTTREFGHTATVELGGHSVTVRGFGHTHTGREK